MPLPDSPTQKPSSQASRASDKSDNELAIKAIVCMLLGLAVLISPYLISLPHIQSIVATSSLVGWFALVLGIGLGVAYGRRKLAAHRADS